VLGEVSCDGESTNCTAGEGVQAVCRPTVTLANGLLKGFDQGET